MLKNKIFNGTLNLDNNNLKFIADGLLRDLGNLKGINLYNHQLKNLPDDLWAIKSLKILNLRNNKLKLLAEEIGDLSELLYLDLRNNNVTEIPKSLLKLHKLEKLDLRCNKYLNQPFWLEELQNNGCIILN
ncbi:hypothetical protein [Legionella longbeachae]|nr:hypothetical protein [Legionella longbeachae]